MTYLNALKGTILDARKLNELCNVRLGIKKQKSVIS